MKDDEWIWINEQEEGESFVSSLVLDIVNKADAVLFERRIQKLLIPFTVEYVLKDSVLKTIKWKYYSRDEGEMNDNFWNTGEEPEPVPIDSWARGVLKPYSTTEDGSNTQELVVVEDEEEEANLSSQSSSVNSSVQSELEDDFTPIGNMPTTFAPVYNQGRRSSIGGVQDPRRQSISPDRRQSISAGRYPGSSHHIKNKVSTTLQKSFAESATETAIIEENRKILARLSGAERESGRFTYDHSGKIVVVKKPPVDKHAIKGVKAHISLPVDNMAQKKLGKKDIESSQELSKPNLSSATEVKGIVKNPSALDYSIYQESPNALLSLMDAIKLAPGVTLREGETIRRGPPLYRKKELPSLSEQLRSKAQSSIYSSSFFDGSLTSLNLPIDQVITKSKPRLRPLNDAPRLSVSSSKEVRHSQLSDPGAMRLGMINERKQDLHATKTEPSFHSGVQLNRSKLDIATNQEYLKRSGNHLNSIAPQFGPKSPVNELRSSNKLNGPVFNHYSQNVLPHSESIGNNLSNKSSKNNSLGSNFGSNGWITKKI